MVLSFTFSTRAHLVLSSDACSKWSWTVISTYLYLQTLISQLTSPCLDPSSKQTSEMQYWHCHSSSEKVTSLNELNNVHEWVVTWGEIPRCQKEPRIYVRTVQTIRSSSCSKSHKNKWRVTASPFVMLNVTQLHDLREFYAWKTYHATNDPTLARREFYF